MNFSAYLLVFLGIYSLYLLFVVSRKKAREQFKKSSYVLYLVNVYKIDVDRLSAICLASLVAFVNSLILTIGVYIAFHVKGIMGIILTFVSMLLLLFLLYHILGKILKKKSERKRGNIR